MAWKPDYLLWLDLETTGSDVGAGGVDCIIEVGATLTDWELNSILWEPYVGVGTGTPWEFSHLVEPTKEGLFSLFNNRTVWRMHTDNGLIEALRAIAPTSSDQIPDPAVHVAEVLIERLIGLGVKPKRCALAGSGVAHFDSRALRHEMPNLMDFLAYPIYDIGVVRRTFQWWVRDEFKDYYLRGDNTSQKPHRALDDAKLHLEEARWYRDVIHNLDPEV